jgi:hypothetical protein
VAEQPRAQQAAEREDQMRDRFNLEPGGEGRPGVDALLRLPDGKPVPFEVKSSDGDNVSTARDVGRDHILKWRQRHWLFGFYERGTRNPAVARRYIYASPRQLEPWIAAQETYVLPDWELVRLLPSAADQAVLAAVAGDKPVYTMKDAFRVLKNQRLEAGEHMTAELRAILQAAGIAEPRRMTGAVYRALLDTPDGFSPERMLVLLRERARYLLDRGATRNNPHIPERTLLRLVPGDQVLPGNVARRAPWLEQMVMRELQAIASATQAATE